MKKELLSALLAHPIFSSLDEDAQELLSAHGRIKKYQKGQTLTLHGDSWPYLLYIIDGEVEAVKESSEGRRLQVAIFQPGEFFWGLAFFHDDAPMPVTLEARRECSVVLWPRERIMPAFLANGTMAWELCRLMSARMLKASAIMEGLAFQPVACRLAHFLIDLAPELHEGPIERSFTLDEAAARIGSTREVVCRFLQRFADQGLIEITRSEFLILEREQLTELAQQVKAQF